MTWNIRSIFPSKYSPTRDMPYIIFNMVSCNISLGAIICLFLVPKPKISPATKECSNDHSRHVVRNTMLDEESSLGPSWRKQWSFFYFLKNNVSKNALVLTNFKLFSPSSTLILSPTLSSPLSPHRQTTATKQGQERQKKWFRKHLSVMKWDQDS